MATSKPMLARADAAVKETISNEGGQAVLVARTHLSPFHCNPNKHAVGNCKQPFHHNNNFCIA